MLFALSYFDTDVSKKVNTGGKKPNKIINKETEHTQILPLSWCMQNYSSLLFLCWHFQRGPFSCIFGKIVFAFNSFKLYIFENLEKGKYASFLS